MCGPRGPRPDRGHRMLRHPTLESVLLHRKQHCDSTGNEKLQPLIMKGEEKEEIQHVSQEVVSTKHCTIIHKSKMIIISGVAHISKHTL